MHPALGGGRRKIEELRGRVYRVPLEDNQTDQVEIDRAKSLQGVNDVLIQHRLKVRSLTAVYLRFFLSWQCVEHLSIPYCRPVGIPGDIRCCHQEPRKDGVLYQFDLPALLPQLKECCRQDVLGCMAIAAEAVCVPEDPVTVPIEQYAECCTVTSQTPRP